MNFIPADKINQRILTFLQAVRSETQCHLSYRRHLVFVYNVNICFLHSTRLFNPLTPKDPYSGRTAPLTSKSCILNIYSTNTGTEYFKHGI